MFDIDKKIADIDEVICDNIDAIDVLGRGLTAQNILSQTRTLIEYVAMKAYSVNSHVEDDYNTNKLSIKYLQTDNKYYFLRKFHNLIQESKSHYTPNKDGAERLTLKYHEYYILLRDFVKKEYGISILHNLNRFPLDLDMAVKGYYIQVAESLRKNWPLIELDKTRLYVMKSRPVYVDGKMIYENTLIPAGDYVSKFDRFIAFSSMIIPDYYAIQASIFSDEISVEKQKMPINLLTDYAVSIRPCELKNFSKLFGNRISLNASYGEYKSLMKYLSITGNSITNILTSPLEMYEKIKDIIKQQGKTFQFIEVMDQARELVDEDRPGSNIIRYLAGTMRNQVLKDQYEIEPNSLLSHLYLKYGCIPFDQMPFSSSPVKHNAEMFDVYASINDEGHLCELLARKIQNNTVANGQIYTKREDLESFGDANQLVQDYNNRLYYKHRSKRSIKEFGAKFLYINETYEDTKAIISKLSILSLSGIGGYRNSIQYWMDRNPEVVNCDEKKNIMLNMFESSNVSLIYGAAGTGKTYLLNHISQFFDDKSKMYLANTNPAVDNLKRKIRTQNGTFYTVAHFVKSSMVEKECDILIMDECSMIGNSDMRQILDKAKFKLLILVGDTYQIEAISFGNWFTMARYFLSRNAWHELKHPYRAQNQELLALWTKVRNMEEDITEHLVHYRYVSVLNESIFERMAEDEIILCLNYNGLYGINNINRFLQNSNHNHGEIWGMWKYKIGDPVLFNETERFSPVIYNNLKGRITRINKENTKIWFEIELEKCVNEWDLDGTELELVGGDSDKSIIGFWVYSDDDEDDEGEDSSNSVVPFQIAYAVSIHKAQGLEYDSVKVVITEDIDEMITHNIFYTAITRAKRNLKIYWSPESQHRVLSGFDKSDELTEATIFSGHSGMRILSRRF